MKSHWQETLESVGVPVSLAAQSAEIIQKESNNPHYQRTPQEQAIISHAHTWWVAQGMKTTGNKNDDQKERTNIKYLEVGTIIG